MCGPVLPSLTVYVTAEACYSTTWLFIVPAIDNAVFYVRYCTMFHRRTIHSALRRMSSQARTSLYSNARRVSFEEASGAERRTSIEPLWRPDKRRACPPAAAAQTASCYK